MCLRYILSSHLTESIFENPATILRTQEKKTIPGQSYLNSGTLQPTYFILFIFMFLLLSNKMSKMYVGMSEFFVFSDSVKRLYLI